ncbi:MAG TPA: sulfurtransferase TusA family protein [Methanotrichaceae archaeon]|nr:sulfurtransferase TusA family protein [Methanotrichaceae archaeon]
MAEVLNLSGVVCPYNFVRTKLKLEEIGRGRELLIILDDPSSAANVSRSLENEGHNVKFIKHSSEELWEILVEKA